MKRNAHARNRETVRASRQRLRCVGSASVAAALAFGAAPRSVSADTVHFDAGIYLCLPFDGVPQPGLGLHAHVWNEFLARENFHAVNEAVPYLGGVLGLDFLHGFQPHLIIAADGGAAGNQGMQVGPHVGVVFRADAGSEVGLHLGVEGRVSVAEVLLTLWPTWNEANLALGARLPAPARGEPVPITQVGRPLLAAADEILQPGYCFGAIQPGAECCDAGALWADRTAAEYASVSAFIQLADQLVRAQAPTQLVQKALRAAVQEHAHARSSGALATRFAGGPLVIEGGPHQTRPAADGTAGLVRLAVEAWRDGCLGERIAAHAAACEATIADDPMIQETQRQIARDEAEHADLGWDVLAFALERGGEVVRHALTAAMPAMPRLSSDSTPHELRAFGCLPLAELRAIAAQVHESARIRLGALLA